MFYVVEGEYFYQVGEGRHRLVSGDTIFLPKQVPHAFIQLTEKGKLIVMYQPAGMMEEFFKKTDSWTSALSPAEIANVFGEHDIESHGTSTET